MGTMFGAVLSLGAILFLYAIAMAGPAGIALFIVGGFVIAALWPAFSWMFGPLPPKR